MWSPNEQVWSRHAKVGKEKCVRTVDSRPEGPRAGRRVLEEGQQVSFPTSCKLPSGVSGGAPAEIEFCVF